MNLIRKPALAFLLFGMFALTLASCKKEDTQQRKFYLVCKMNGVKKEFSVVTTGFILHENGYTQLTVGGFTDSTTANAYAIGFTLTNVPSKDSVAEGNYADTTTRYEVLGAYDKMDGSIHYDAGTSVYQDQVHYSVAPTNHFVGTITSITSEGIRGTFTGDFYNDGDVQQPDIIVVTEGEFYVQRLY